MLSIDEDREVRARIGVMVPSGNILAEEQLHALMPPEVALHVTRLPLTGSSDADLDGMTRALPLAARMLADARVDLIAFNCTAVSTRAPDADAAIVARIAEAAATPAVTTGEALVAGLRALEARRVVLVTPYIAPVVAREAAFLAHHGAEVLAAVGKGIDTNWEMGRAPPRVWHDYTLAQRHAQADAYVLSCTAIRTLGAIAPLEAALGRPVLTSNQAIAWLALRRCGIATPLPGAGRLFEVAEASPPQGAPRNDHLREETET